MPSANTILNGLEAYAKYNGIIDNIDAIAGITGIVRNGTGDYSVTIQRPIDANALLPVVRSSTTGVAIAAIVNTSGTVKQILMENDLGAPANARIYIAFYRVYIQT